MRFIHVLLRDHLAAVALTRMPPDLARDCWHDERV
jgi:hypothetical protein